MMGFRRRALGHLAERVRLDNWLLAIHHTDLPIPFWPVDHPAELEYVPAALIDSPNDPL